MRISAIVLSYNRPRMLRQCLASVFDNAPSEVIVVDDGSDFDVLNVAREYWHDAHVIIADPLSPEARMTVPRLGSMINRALDLATGDVITYLCDDDLWADGWLDRVRDYYRRHPAIPLVRGAWLSFQSDYERPSPDCPPCDLDDRGMTTGNFAHRRDCPGARWPDDTLSSHDDIFLWGIERAGVDVHHTPLIGFAGYRRVHDYNMLNFTVANQYTPEAAAIFSQGMLEP